MRTIGISFDYYSFRIMREELVGGTTDYSGGLAGPKDPMIAWFWYLTCPTCGFPQVMKKDYNTSPCTITLICSDKPNQHRRVVSQQ